jgi:hypothetical protein
VGDIDLAALIVPKEKDHDKYVVLKRRRATELLDKGKTFRNVIEELFCAELEVRRYLKGRGRSIDLQDYQDHGEWIETLPHRVLLEMPDGPR